MAQTSYSVNMAVAYAGMKADMFNDDVESMFNEEASAEMPFGVMLAQGTADSGALLPDSDTEILVGVLLHSHEYAKDSELGSTGVKPDAALNVLRKGRVWVTVEEAVSPGDRPYVRYAGSGQEGAFRKSAVIGETIDARAWGVFRTSADASGLALLELDMTNA